MKTTLSVEVSQIVKLLRKKRARIVLAESCTGGLLASLFTEIPGVSDHFCGSHVVYREDSKMRWLGVKASTLKKHTAVSEECAEEMARGALKNTKEATIAAAVTGYLGPKGERVGQVFISVLERRNMFPITIQLDLTQVPTHNLRKTPRKRTGISAVEKRLLRREMAAAATLFLVRSSLQG